MQTPGGASEHRAEMARAQAIHGLPVEPYLGMTLAEAEERAQSEGRTLQVLQSMHGPNRPSLSYLRLKIALDVDGLVTGAEAG